MNIRGGYGSASKFSIEGEDTLVAEGKLFAPIIPKPRREATGLEDIQYEVMISRSAIHIAFWQAGVEYNFSFSADSGMVKLLEKVSMAPGEYDKDPIYGDVISRETTRTVIPDAKVLVETARKEVERLKEQGWTRADFAKSLVSLLEGEDGKDN